MTTLALPAWLNPSANFRARLFWVMGIAAIASAGLNSALVGRNSTEQVKHDKGVLMAEVASQMAREMDKGIFERLREVQIIASLQTIQNPDVPLAEKHALLEKLKASYENYAWIGFTDAQGNILAGTGGLLVGKSVAKRDWFIQGSQGPHVGNVHDAFLLAKILPKPKHDFLPLRLLDVSAPIRNERGELLGVICGHLSWDWSFQVKNALLEPLKSSMKADVLIIDKNSKVLLGTPQLQQLTETLDLPSTRAARHEHSGFLTEDWPDGKQYLTGYAASAGYMSYSGLGWKVLVRQEAREAFTAARSLRNTTFAFGALAALLFISLLWPMTGRLTKPLRAIASAASRIRSGHKEDIPVFEGRDEAAVLSQSLHELVSTLEFQKQDLASKNQQLHLAAQVFASSTEGIIITDAGQRVLSVNTAFTEITGYAAEEMVGRYPNVLQSGRQDEAFYHALHDSLKRHGRWQGEIWNRRKNGEVYPEWLIINSVRDAQEQITHYIGIFTDITERKQAEDRILHLANHDALTDLPNRLYFLEKLHDALARTRRNRKQLAVLFIDLDRFKNVNDSLGHHIGDLLLIDVAKRLRAVIHETCPEGLVARWGGDEFVVFFPDINEGGNAAHLASRVNSALAQTFLIDANYELNITSSIGIALFPDDGADVVALTKNADAAMYHAKETGRDNYQFFTEALHAQVSERLALENALRHALARNELSLHYQPQVDTQSGHIVGVEALMRWQHPTLGQVSPARFIPLAEDTGLITSLGEWALRSACLQQVDWKMRLGVDLRMAVNLSSIQFQHDDLAGEVLKIARESGIAMSSLELEITESVLLDSAEKAADTLQQLHNAGIQIALDDFGTGYSSLSYLNRLTLSRIKIDQSFIRDLDTHSQNASIVPAIIAIARELKLDLIAEGVETQAQLHQLQRLGCREAQGYLFSRPRSVADLESDLMRGTFPTRER